MSFDPSLEGDFITLVNHNPDMISRINKDMVVLYVNDAVCKSIGKPREYFIGKSVYELTGEGEGQELFRKRLEEVLTTGQRVQYQAEGWFDASSYFHFDIIPLEVENGKVQHVLSMFKDISTSKKNEDQLKRSIKELEIISDQLIYQNKLLRDFTYITSHNLRSPISNIKALLQLYEVYEGNEAEKKVVFEKLKNMADTLAKTISELSYTINLKGNLRKELEEIDFKVQLEEVIQSLYTDVEDSGAAIKMNFVNAPAILYPKVYLESIFLNLLTNSIKYRSKDRPLVIEVETFRQDERVVLKWKDNGIGIDIEKHGAKLFTLKYTFHDREDARGIGLYITRNQIESVGGSISVDSKVGEGTTFTIVF